MQTLTIANSCGANDKSQVPADPDRADPDRRAGADAGRRVRADPATATRAIRNRPMHSRLPGERDASRGRSRSMARPRTPSTPTASRVLIPKPGEIEHWTYINGGGGWDHPIHLHFEEGITMNRGGGSDPRDRAAGPQGRVAAAPGGQVQFQVQFGEYGGSYVNHCHNTVHEDFAMLMRIQLLAKRARCRLR